MATTNTPTTAIEKRPEPAGAINVPDRQEQTNATWYTPLVDLIDNDDGFVFQADLPGVKAGDVDVSFENGTLTIQAKAEQRQPAGQSYLWREYGVGHFYRTFTIASPIDADGIKAQLKNGVLELFVPKDEAAKPRKIQVKAG